VSAVTVLGVEFRPGALVCMEISDKELPVFGGIDHIFVQGERMKFLVQVHETSPFSHHLFAYSITNTNSYVIVDVGSLKMHKVYHKYYVNSVMYTSICLCHVVEFDI
jgi:hypothetical protein